MSEQEKWDERKDEYRKVIQFLEWCRWHGYTIIGPDPFEHKRGKNEPKLDRLDMVRSESIHGSPLDAIWCEHIGVDYEQLQREQSDAMEQAVDEALGGSDD